ncbi:MAG TPA: AmmeMemoRadiSam system protein A [Anaerolineales bacterium]|nr:AmmeMemoRadiSam system protein A [Anaerolineales bacterium]
MQERLTIEEQKVLLRLAREAMEQGVRGRKLPPLDETLLTPNLREEGSSFVTLTEHGQLRGCIGSLEPHQSLVEDVREHAVAAALQDPRFHPVKEAELNGIQIEVSRLTPPIPLDYKDADDLLSSLHPHVDGVILRDGFRRATFLPQVWEKITDPAEFLDNLCYKMGTRPDLWRKKHLDVLTYKVEEFHE